MASAKHRASEVNVNILYIRQMVTESVLTSKGILCAPNEQRRAAVCTTDISCPTLMNQSVFQSNYCK